MSKDSPGLSTLCALNRYEVATWFWNQYVIFAHNRHIFALRLNFKFANSHTFFHCLSLTTFTCVAQCNFFCGLGSSLEFWEFLTPISFLVFCMPASTFCHLSVFALLIQCYGLDGVDLAFRTELAQLLLHLHINKMSGEGNLRTRMKLSSLS